MSQLQQAKYSALALSLFMMLYCGKSQGIQILNKEEGKTFDKIHFEKVAEVIQWGGWCMDCSKGIFCFEVLDPNWREFKLRLLDYSGIPIKEKTISSGDGPDEIRVTNFSVAWPSSSGKIICIDNNNFLKAIDPETLDISTIAKLSNVINKYGSKYTLSAHSATSLEENNGFTVTSFESSGFPDDMTYYIVMYQDLFKDLSVILKTKKIKPLTWAKYAEGVAYVDYYVNLRPDRIFSVDWKNKAIYILPDIEKPEIESIDFEGKNRIKYRIDINYEQFKFDKSEFEFLQNSNKSWAVDTGIKDKYKHMTHIPPHALALMGVKVIKDRLLIITGNRNWEEDKNEVLVYRLPSLEYEGSFYIPFPNLLRVKWHDNKYMIKKIVEREDGHYQSYEFYDYTIEEK